AGVTGLSLVTTAFVWGPSLLRPSVSRERVRIGKVETGPVEASITASGTVLPEVEEVLASPMEARVLKILRRPGDVLKKGDPIVELDLSESILAVEKLDRDLALKVNKQASTRLDLEARLNEIEAKREIKRLELESLRSQLARNRTLSAEGLISEETLKLSELAEAKAAVELRQLEADARTAEKSTRTQIAGLDLEMATLRGERGQARRQLELATTKADRDGVLTWALSEEGAAIHKGDVIARLADLRSFRGDATVSDVPAREGVPGIPAGGRGGGQGRRRHARGHGGERRPRGPERRDHALGGARGEDEPAPALADARGRPRDHGPQAADAAGEARPLRERRRDAGRLRGA